MTDQELDAIVESIDAGIGYNADARERQTARDAIYEVVTEVRRLRTALAAAERERDEARRAGAEEERARIVADLRRLQVHGPQEDVAELVHDTVLELATRYERGEHVPAVKS